MSCIHQHTELPEGITIADNFTVDFCEHGHGEIALFRKGAMYPFAVAYFGPKAVMDLARTFSEAIQTKGNA